MELLEQWQRNRKKKEMQEKKIDELMKKAEEGDVGAMEEASANFFFGQNGFKKDKAAAYKWCKNAHRAGSLQATYSLGMMLIDDDAAGHGFLHGGGRVVVVQKNVVQGISYLTRAAENHNSHAAFRLGMAYADGEYGLPVDAHEARYFLKIALDKGDLKDDYKDQAFHKLVELPSSEE